MSERRVTFECFDPAVEVEISAGHLPHWLQIGSAMFITFRTADSMPKAVLLHHRRELADYLLRCGLPAREATRVLNQRPVERSMLSQLPAEKQREFQRKEDRLWHRSLDECHGKCLLKNQDLAKIVGDAIRKFDGVKYDLDRLIIMPNHVHVIVQFRQGYSLSVVSQSWLRFSARQLNATIGRQGVFWQGEPFDHLIRSEEQFRYLQRYVEENPAKASLRAGESLFWKRE